MCQRRPPFHQIRAKPITPAYGEAAADPSRARVYRAQAISLEIQNSVDYIKACERRSIGEAENSSGTKRAQKEDIATATSGNASKTAELSSSHHNGTR
jgi:hypothetical protein